MDKRGIKRKRNDEESVDDVGRPTKRCKLEHDTWPERIKAPLDTETSMLVNDIWNALVVKKKHVVLTGEGGSGKTTAIKWLINNYLQVFCRQQYKIIGSTAKAATLYSSGRTIHSALAIPAKCKSVMALKKHFANFTPQWWIEKRNDWKSVHTVIIEEFAVMGQCLYSLVLYALCYFLGIQDKIDERHFGQTRYAYLQDFLKNDNHLSCFPQDLFVVKQVLEEEGNLRYTFDFDTNDQKYLSKVAWANLSCIVNNYCHASEWIKADQEKGGEECNDSSSSHRFILVSLQPGVIPKTASVPYMLHLYDDEYAPVDPSKFVMRLKTHTQVVTEYLLHVIHRHAPHLRFVFTGDPTQLDCVNDTLVVFDDWFTKVMREPVQFVRNKNYRAKEKTLQQILNLLREKINSQMKSRQLLLKGSIKVSEIKSEMVHAEAENLVLAKHLFNLLHPDVKYLTGKAHVTDIVQLCTVQLEKHLPAFFQQPVETLKRGLLESYDMSLWSDDLQILYCLMRSQFPLYMTYANSMRLEINKCMDGFWLHFCRQLGIFLYDEEYMVKRSTSKTVANTRCDTLEPAWYKNKLTHWISNFYKSIVGEKEKDNNKTLVVYNSDEYLDALKKRQESEYWLPFNTNMISQQPVFLICNYTDDHYVHSKVENLHKEDKFLSRLGQTDELHEDQLAHMYIGQLLRCKTNVYNPNQRGKLELQNGDMVLVRSIRAEPRHNDEPKVKTYTLMLQKISVVPKDVAEWIQLVKLNTNQELLQLCGYDPLLNNLKIQIKYALPMFTDALCYNAFNCQGETFPDMAAVLDMSGLKNKLKAWYVFLSRNQSIGKLRTVGIKTLFDLAECLYIE